MIFICSQYFLVWSISHPLTWRRQDDLRPILQSVTRWRLRRFGFTFRALSCQSSLYTVCCCFCVCVNKWWLLPCTCVRGCTAAAAERPPWQWPGPSASRNWADRSYSTGWWPGWWHSTGTWSPEEKHTELLKQLKKETKETINRVPHSLIQCGLPLFTNQNITLLIKQNMVKYLCVSDCGICCKKHLIINNNSYSYILMLARLKQLI